MVFWTRSQIESGSLLTLADAALFVAALTAARLAFDPVYGNLFVSDTAFGATSIREYDAAGHLVDIPVASDLWVSNLELVRKGGLGHFHRFQPDTGVVLYYAATDFFGTYEARNVAPARPLAVLTRNGSTNTLAVTGGQPSGAFQVIYGRKQSAEQTYAGQFADFLFHSRLRLPYYKLRGTVALDENGAGQVTFPARVPFPTVELANSSGLMRVGFQALILAPDGVTALGSSNTE